MTEQFFKECINLSSKTKIDTAQYSPLVLAYIGDAVYEVYIRTKLISNGNASVYKLHKLAIQYVKAKAQSDIIEHIKDQLTEEECRVYKRGRNAKSGTVPKNADIHEYHRATGLEAIIGYLYLEGNYKRLMEILELTYRK